MLCALPHFIENWRKALDSGITAGAVIMDLSNAFDCLNHGLVIAKLEAYGFSRGAVAYPQISRYDPQAVE